MVQELCRILTHTVEHNVLEDHLQIPTHMNREAESAMGQERASLIAEAIQALYLRDASTAQQLRARETMAELRNQHQQTPQLRNELTGVTEEGTSIRESTPAALALAGDREKAAEQQLQYDRFVQERKHAVIRLENTTQDP